MSHLYEPVIVDEIRYRLSRLRITDKRDFDVELRRLYRMIDRFVAAGPAGCTTHPHTFMGALTPVEWATLMYRHLDHHLRQFEA